MKRIMLLLFCCVVVLCACGKNEKVKSVEDLISKIGVVSFSSKESIDAAKNAYDTLSATEQKQVENYHILEEAQKAYDALGIQITLENYSKYLNVNIDTYLSDGMDLGQWVGIGKTVNDTVYTSIKSVVTISGKSNNYDYNDITVRVKFTGNYLPLTLAEDWDNEYVKKNTMQIDFELTTLTDIIGNGYNEKIIKSPDWGFLKAAHVEINYEIVEISGSMTPVK